MASVYRSAALQAARIAGESSEMDAAASRIHGEIEAGATAIADSGDFARSIRAEHTPGRKGVTDRVVYSDDPAAYLIEFGFVDKRNGSDHPGHFIFSNVVRSHGG